MLKYLFSSVVMTLLCVILFSGIYTGVVYGVAQIAPGKGMAERIETPKGIVYANIGQNFTEDRYFQSRPSAAGYNASSSAGSNKGPSNPDYLQAVSDRIDTFMVHNPGIDRADIPSDIVTASGSGLDPNISIAAAEVQIPRIARIRQIPEDSVKQLLAGSTVKPFGGVAGPECINVLKLNLALDAVR